MPFAHQRGDPLHQPDQDARIPRRPACPVVSTPIARRGPPLRRPRRRARSPPAPTPSSPPAPPPSPRRRGSWRQEADARLAGLSWDATHAAMAALVDAAAARKAAQRAAARRPAPCAGPSVRPTTSSSSAPASPARCSPSAWPRPRASASSSATAATHVGGNAYDAPDAAGILVHRYGPHIFHTNSDEVVDYLSRFTAWRPYEHRVLAERRRPAAADADQPHHARPRSSAWPLADEAAAERLLASLAEPVAKIGTAERRRGRHGRHATSTRPSSRATPASSGASTRPSSTTVVTARVPTRTTDDDRYFLDTLPGDARATATPGCSSACSTTRASTLALGTDFHDRRRVAAPLVVYTGPIDALLRPPLRRAALPQPRLPLRDPRPPARSRRSASSTIPPRTCRTRGSPSTST